MALRTALAALCLTASLVIAARCTEASATIVPRDLLIYYSWPSLINGASGNIEVAAAEFARYDDIVLGDLLEKVSHPDHANTVAILAHPSLASVRSFGYIDLGLSPGQNLPLAEIQIRVDEWLATGVSGILFDEFGYDYGVSRERQNAAVSYAKSRGLVVIANAWVPSDALGDDVHPTLNPTGLPTALTAQDFYLFESFQVQEGAFVPESFWQLKATELETFRESIGVFAVTTKLPEDVYDEEKFYYAWFSSLLYGYDALGWGEYLFAALDAQAPFRARPGIDPGETFLSEIVHQSPEHWRFSNAGRIRVDAAAHTYGFIPGTTGIVSEDASALRSLSIWPNPASGAISIAFSSLPLSSKVAAPRASSTELATVVSSKVAAPRARPTELTRVAQRAEKADVDWSSGPSVLVVTDAQGRRIDSVRVPAGASRITWTPGEDLASGWYFIDLERNGASLASGRVLRVR